MSREKFLGSLAAAEMSKPSAAGGVQFNHDATEYNKVQQVLQSTALTGHQMTRDEWMALFDQFNLADADNSGTISKEEWIADGKLDPKAFDIIDRNHDGEVDREEFEEMLKADQEFEGMDTNNFAGKGGAGVISKDEWVEQHGGSLEGFDEYDLNHDGVIDQDEYRIGKIGDKTFKGMDTNADHKISKEEWAAQHGGDTAGFDEYDLNHDGEVSQAEYRAVNAAKLQFDRLDANHDNKISREEFIAQFGEECAHFFDEYDTNHDGSIDAAEWLAARIDVASFKECTRVYCANYPKDPKAPPRRVRAGLCFECASCTVGDSKPVPPKWEVKNMSTAETPREFGSPCHSVQRC